MNSKTVQFTVHFSIKEGMLSGFESTARRMSALAQEECGTLAYDWFLSDDRTSGRLFEHYEDAQAVDAHLSGTIVQELVPELMRFVSVDKFDVNGDPGPEAAAALGSFGATIFKSWSGSTAEADS